MSDINKEFISTVTLKRKMAKVVEKLIGFNLENFDYYYEVDKKESTHFCDKVDRGGNIFIAYVDGEILPGKTRVIINYHGSDLEPIYVDGHQYKIDMECKLLFKKDNKGFYYCPEKITDDDLEMIRIDLLSKNNNAYSLEFSKPHSVKSNKALSYTHNPTYNFFNVCIKWPYYMKSKHPGVMHLLYLLDSNLDIIYKDIQDEAIFDDIEKINWIKDNNIELDFLGNIINEEDIMLYKIKF